MKAFGEYVIALLCIGCFIAIISAAFVIIGEENDRQVELAKVRKAAEELTMYADRIQDRRPLIPQK